MSASRRLIPRLPVFGWPSWLGMRQAELPCMLDMANCHLTTSGRASIALALEVLGIGPGDTVLLPTYHCPTMVAPSIEQGAGPRFYPIDANGSPNLEWLDKQDLRSARVLLVPHLFGLPQPMALIREWCDARGLALLEDCAHSLFGSSDGRPAGSWGDISVGSLTKFLPVPEGGCLVLNKGQAAPDLSRCSATTEIKAWVDILEEGARYGRMPGLNHLIALPLEWSRKLRRPAPAGPGSATQASVTRNRRAADIEAGLAIDMTLAHREVQSACRWLAGHLPRHRIVERRRSNYEALARGLDGHAGVHPLLRQLPQGAAPYVFPLWVDQPDPAYQRLREAQIPVFRWDRLWPGVPDLEGDHGKQWSHHIIQVACHQDLSDADLDWIVQHLLRICAKAT
jgi:perosamine synthetase